MSGPFVYRLSYNIKISIIYQTFAKVNTNARKSQIQYNFRKNAPNTQKELHLAIIAKKVLTM